ncbi:flavin reductase family protein [Loktanella salsilacus]|uniref:flavin reductase family protein n=1 Tax=Loktanella salsilacus TaxID=195913 RepID=UPI0020B85517|nr:flavin reductase family protein [Loktanella salsilacus]UTH43458.1 flavin reductase family protein [Loktanella salsilacus]UTH49214.1 flavin reductase family protein [Loktanella salsilacus]
MTQPEDFTNGMRRLAAGVSLITTQRDGVRYGLIATAVTSVCAAPPTLLICVNRTASIHEHLIQSGSFCVNVLSANQSSIATRFATPKDRETRFDVGNWTARQTGAPALQGACVSFDCRTSHHMAQGTHTVLFGLIENVWLQDEAAPLTYHGGRFGTLTQIT